MRLTLTADNGTKRGPNSAANLKAAGPGNCRKSSCQCGSVASASLTCGGSKTVLDDGFGGV